MIAPLLPAQTSETLASANTPAADAVPSGTTLHIRLRQTISSFGSKQDTPISAIVIQPVELDGQIVLPMNTELHGVVARVRRVGVGLSHETAQLDLQFDTFILPENQPQALAGQITAVDNSRETVDPEGMILGIRSTASTAKALSGLAISAAALDPMSQLFAASASLSAFRIPESEIILPVGTELTYRVNQAVPVTQHSPGIPAFFKDESQETELTTLVRPLPFRTETTKPVTPSDLITLVYLGSEDSIKQAFDAAGWVPAGPLSAESKYGVMRSIIENQGYREGPVSTLLLNGQAPTLVFSKTLDTFFARHHHRIYSQPGTFDGKPIFSSTATHRSGIGLNKKAKSMIHLHRRAHRRRARQGGRRLVAYWLRRQRQLPRPAVGAARRQKRFQFGRQYGGGFKYQITPRLFLRADFRQTLSPQPDYWTKSYPTLRKGLVEDPGDVVEIKPYQKFGPLRQNVTTLGFGISF